MKKNLRFVADFAQKAFEPVAGTYAILGKENGQTIIPLIQQDGPGGVIPADAFMTLITQDPKDLKPFLARVEAIPHPGSPGAGDLEIKEVVMLTAEKYSDLINLLADAVAGNPNCITEYSKSRRH